MENELEKTLTNDNNSLVTVRGLVKHFAVENSDDVVRAVDGVSFEIFQGETLGLVGDPVVASPP